VLASLSFDYTFESFHPISTISRSLYAYTIFARDHQTGAKIPKALRNICVQELDSLEGDEKCFWWFCSSRSISNEDSIGIQRAPDRMNRAKFSQKIRNI